MNINLKICLIISLLTLIGGFLRFYGNTKNPNSLNIDEVSYGYSAYSILKTARDENNVFMPITFQSTGDYKSPLLIYSLVPSIAAFGLNEFSVRFTTALAGTFSIPFFFLFLNLLFKNIKVSFVGAVLLTISPWHIFYSRFASETLLATFFLIFGMWLLLKFLENVEKIWGILGGAVLVLSMYTYHSHKLFIPIFIFSSFLLFKKKILSLKKNTAISLLVSFILLAPLLYVSISGSANTRAKMVFLSQDIDYTRYVILDHSQKFGEELLLFYFWIKRYLNYFQPDFLFFNGLNMTISGSLGLGVVYLFELPWLILGIEMLIRRKLPNKGFTILWILLGIIPASLTNNEQSTVRSLLILPALLAIISLGVLRFIEIVNGLSNQLIKIIFFSLCGLFILIILIQAYLVFVVHYPLQRGEAFMEGTKETVLYALENQDKYREIVFDPFRGIEAPYIVNIPHMYILFYSQYNPATYQMERKEHGNEYFHFNKFTIRRIDWRTDRSSKNILFVGSPWALPVKDIKDEEILRKVYLSNGNLALLIVKNVGF